MIHWRSVRESIIIYYNSNIIDIKLKFFNRFFSPCNRLFYSATTKSPDNWLLKEQFFVRPQNCQIIDNNRRNFGADGFSFWRNLLYGHFRLPIAWIFSKSYNCTSCGANLFLWRQKCQISPVAEFAMNLGFVPFPPTSEI